jgi:hypothetical protein
VKLDLEGGLLVYAAELSLLDWVPTLANIGPAMIGQ